ncbi:hypothetical protein GALMADRAFT_147741 [Galerina marginata CBS 339.88]|uniref:Uncharacterized protein n=1 Tax=Galerina marginata (strain CBS 339.88) TaxID=685588 RepID=A0A067SG21_GALM3|nr:hypothetical protein GALMADRAFT_147741 [Galerina marginata CBS 339.88]
MYRIFLIDVDNSPLDTLDVERAQMSSTLKNSHPSSHTICATTSRRRAASNPTGPNLKAPTLPDIATSLTNSSPEFRSSLIDTRSGPRKRFCYPTLAGESSLRCPRLRELYVRLLRFLEPLLSRTTIAYLGINLEDLSHATVPRLPYRKWMCAKFTSYGTDNAVLLLFLSFLCLPLEYRICIAGVHMTWPLKAKVFSVVFFVFLPSKRRIDDVRSSSSLFLLRQIFFDVFCVN